MILSVGVMEPVAPMENSSTIGPIGTWTVKGKQSTEIGFSKGRAWKAFFYLLCVSLFVGEAKLC